VGEAVIIVRSPLRITLGGGGTDLPSYYRKYGGLCIAAAINKYVYVSITKPFEYGVYLKYSRMEKITRVSDIEHPIIRETLKEVGHPTRLQIEITTLADIPSGTGLGSSGSFATALIKALHAYGWVTTNLTTESLAQLACKIEVDILQKPIGKLDQYASAYGGIRQFNFDVGDRVWTRPLTISNHTLYELEDNLLLFFTGFSRDAGGVLIHQELPLRNGDAVMQNNFHETKRIGEESLKALEYGNCRLFGELLHRHWENKKTRVESISNGKINEWYELGCKNGAIGGKLVGAGGGGFLMFYAEDARKLRSVMAKAQLEELRFTFDFEGTKVLL